MAHEEGVALEQAPALLEGPALALPRREDQRPARPVERGVVRPNYPAQEQFVASPEVAAATQGAMGEFQLAQQAAAKARAAP